jgi:two-component system sensor histidine kinase KdpD
MVGLTAGHESARRQAALSELPSPSLTLAGLRYNVVVDGAGEARQVVNKQPATERTGPTVRVSDDRFAGRSVNWRSRGVDTLLALAVVTGISVLVGAIESVGHVSNISNLYIIGIAVLASRRGLYPALVASVLAFLAVDWFFIPPVHAFTADDPSQYVVLLTLLVTAVIIGQLLAVARKRMAEAGRARRQLDLLYEVSQASLSSPQVSSVYPLALWRLNDALGLTGSRLFLRDGAALSQPAASGTLPEDAEEASWVDRVSQDAEVLVVWERSPNKLVATALDLAERTFAVPEGARLYQILLPLRIDSHVVGVLVVGEKKAHTPITVEDRQLLLAFAGQLAVAVGRQGRSDLQDHERALEESDRLKSALISSTSHEFKTPLAAIKVAATALLYEAVGPKPSVRRELAESINRETDRLTRLVSNFLDMSRVEAGALRPQREWASIADVVADVLDRMEPSLGGRDIHADFPEKLPLSPLDFVQISQVLDNLLDNAVRYSPREAAITISAEVVRDQLRVTVFNEGSHIPPLDLDRVFDRFYRLNATTGGVGLGLSIARGIVEAHKGRIWAENVGYRGVVFKFTLPSPARQAADTPGSLLKSAV